MPSKVTLTPPPDLRFCQFWNHTLLSSVKLFHSVWNTKFIHFFGLLPMWVCVCVWGGGGGVSMINAFRSCFFTYCAPINVKPAGGVGERQGSGQGFGRSLWPGGRAFELSCYLGVVIFDFLQTFDHNRGYIESKCIRVSFVEVYS